MSFLQIKDLKVYYHTQRGLNKAVDGVSLELKKGQSIGIVGESGCGKSTLARAIIGVMDKNATIAGGTVILDGQDLLKCTKKQINQIRWNKMAMVPQAAMDSLNPVYTVGNQFIEILMKKGNFNRKDAQKRAEDLFESVALDSYYLKYYPHEFSGGMKQRAVIALAFALNPELLITDEPVTALDVIVQHQVLKELKKLKNKLKVALVMITHDISVVANTCDLIAVMYAGKIVEQGKVEDILNKPTHPYTMGLENAFPSLKNPNKTLISIEGAPPNLADAIVGCRFEDRCPFKIEICKTEEPPLTEIFSNHFSACHRSDEVELLRAESKETETWQRKIS